MRAKVAGFFKMEAVKIDSGDRRILADWFPNIITNQGLDRMATNYEFILYCQVGTGSTTPTASDTALVNRVGSTGAFQSRSFTVHNTSPYYRSNIFTMRFSPGSATGNLSEVGMGWASSGSLFSRALILDSYGNPTTITVLSDEYLDVTYEYRFYPKEADTTGSITLTGNKGATYNYTLRPANITNFPGQFGTSYNSKPSAINNCYFSSGYGYGTGYYRVYDGVKGAITGLPSGNYLDLNYMTLNTSYTAGTYTVTQILSIPINLGNLAAGIKCIVFTWGCTHWQIEFDNPIMKTSEDTLTLTFTHTWGRV